MNLILATERQWAQIAHDDNLFWINKNPLFGRVLYQSNDGLGIIMKFVYKFAI